jgi:hypothetical protein
MVQRLHERLTFANVTSVIALFIALGGSAWALSKNTVGAPQIKKNAVGSSELKNNKTTGKDVNESSLGKVPSAANADSATNASSAAIAGNATNLGGLPASEYLHYGSTIPSGKTVVGGWGVAERNLTINQVAAPEAVSFPLPAPVGLTGADVNFGPSDSAQDDDPTCTGSAVAPTAPPGKACVYIGENAATNVGGSMRASEIPGATRFGFIVVANSVLAGGIEVYGSWAYTAP